MPETDRGAGGRFVSNRMAPPLPPYHGRPGSRGTWVGLVALVIVGGLAAGWYWWPV